MDKKEMIDKLVEVKDECSKKELYGACQYILDAINIIDESDKLKIKNNTGQVNISNGNSVINASQEVKR